MQGHKLHLYGVTRWNCSSVKCRKLSGILVEKSCLQSVTGHFGVKHLPGLGVAYISSQAYYFKDLRGLILLLLV